MRYLLALSRVPNSRSSQAACGTPRVTLPVLARLGATFGRLLWRLTGNLFTARQHVIHNRQRVIRVVQLIATEPTRTSESEQTTTMRLASSLVGLLAAASTLAGIADAKYFSEGWKPGQPTTAVNAQPTPYSLPKVVPRAKTPKRRPEPPRSFTDKALLKVASLTGMKIPSLTDESSLDRYTWANDDKEGIERLTDDNWEEEVEYEHIPFGEDRVWIIILHGPPRDPLTPMFYDAHTNATALARKNNDLPHVKWARIDYITESILSTRWLVFKPPYIVIVTDRGQTLRFLHPQEIVPDGELLYRFVKEREWAKLPVWRSEWAPGGSRAWIINLWISLSTGYTKLTGGIPSWLVLIGTGMITQSLLKLMHTGRRSAPAPVSAPVPGSKAAKSD